MRSVWIDISDIPTGACDRLRKVCLAIAIASALDVEILEICEDETLEGPYAIVDYLKCSCLTLKRRNTPSRDVICLSLPLSPASSFPSLGNAEIVFSLLKSSLSDTVFTSPAHLLESWLKAYTTIAFVHPLAESQLNKLLQSDYWVLHLRATDRFVLIASANQIDALTLCEMFMFLAIPRLWLSPNESLALGRTVAICSDSRVLYLVACFLLPLFGYNLFSPSPPVFAVHGIRRTNHETLLRDLVLMQYSTAIISTVGAGLPFTINAMSMGRKVIILFVSLSKWHYLLRFLRKHIKRFLS